MINMKIEQEFENNLDVNYFYMIEYICPNCSNICSKNDDACPICGVGQIRKTIISRSCRKYSTCTSLECTFASHEEVSVCPSCGSRTRTADVNLLEDLFLAKIPSMEQCSGSLRDDDVGFEDAKHYSMYGKIKR